MMFSRSSFTNGSHSSDTLSIQPQRLLRGISIPNLSQMFCCRYKGMWSQYLAIIVYATSSGVAMLLGNSRLGIGAILTFSWHGLQTYFGRTCCTTLSLAGIY